MHWLICRAPSGVKSVIGRKINRNGQVSLPLLLVFHCESQQNGRLYRREASRLWWPYEQPFERLPPFFTRFAYFFPPQFLCVCLCNCVRLVGQQRIRYLPIVNASTSRCRVINHLFMISSQKDPYRFSRRSALTTGARTQTYTHTHTHGIW